MAKYRITAPAKDVTETIHGVAFDKSVAEAELGEDKASVLAYFRRQGYKVEDLDALAAEEKAAAAAAKAAELPPAPKAPAKSALKPEWVAFAVTQGMTEAEAEGMTKEALAEKFAPQTGGNQ